MLFLRIQIVSTPYCKDGACLSLKKNCFMDISTRIKKKKRSHITLLFNQLQTIIPDFKLLFLRFHLFKQIFILRILLF